ncbi:transposase [Gordonia sp. NPDC003424]
MKALGMALTVACALVGVSRATYYRLVRGYRHYTPVADPVPQAQRGQPAALSVAERDQVVDVLCRPEYADLSIFQTYWRAFDSGLVRCSQRTFYRIAKAAKLVGDRRRRKHCGTAATRRTPRVMATAPGQLWSWDATELRGPSRQRYKLLLVIDVFSRFPVAWKVVAEENTAAAVVMFTEAFTRYGPPRMLHADNGAVMRSTDLLDALEASGVIASFSRPRVSDDNPFSESLFKTVKYDLDCPEYFDDIDHARDWTRQFLEGYAHEHRHSGIGCYTPASVFDGSFVEIQKRRQVRLDELHAAHPERYRGGRPKAPVVPAIVGINHKPTKPKKNPVTDLSQAG